MKTIYSLLLTLFHFYVTRLRCNQDQLTKSIEQDVKNNIINPVIVLYIFDYVMKQPVTLVFYSHICLTYKNKDISSAHILPLIEFLVAFTSTISIKRGTFLCQTPCMLFYFSGYPVYTYHLP